MKSMIRRFSVALILLAVNYCYSQNSFSREELIYTIKVLSADSLEGRKAGSEGNKKAQTYIVKRLKEIGIKSVTTDSYLQPFTVTQTFGKVENGSCANILAEIEGKSNESIVISAHYDHVGVIRNVIYNGADDNASGAAALLAIAAYFQKNPPRHRLIIAFFDAEEMGLRGSAHFVNTADLKKENIVLNINMDMISRSEKNELYACGTYYHPELKNHLENLEVPATFKLLFGHDDPSSRGDDWTSQSDQKKFPCQKYTLHLFWGGRPCPLSQTD